MRTDRKQGASTTQLQNGTSYHVRIPGTVHRTNGVLLPTHSVPILQWLRHDTRLPANLPYLLERVTANDTCQKGTKRMDMWIAFSNIHRNPKTRSERESSENFHYIPS